MRKDNGKQSLSDIENMTCVFFRVVNVVGYNTVKMRILLICLLKYINDLIEALCFNVLEFKMENSIYSVYLLQR